MAPGGGQGSLNQVVNDGALKGRDEPEGSRIAVGERVQGPCARPERLGALGDGRREMVGFYVAEDGGFDSREGEKCIGAPSLLAAFARADLGKTERDRSGVAVGGKRVDPGTPRVGEAEQLPYLIEGLAGGVVDGAADRAVLPTPFTVGCGI